MIEKKLTRPACYALDDSVRATFAIDQGRHCRAWHYEGHWLQIGHDCDGCKRLQRARELGVLKEKSDVS